MPAPALADERDEARTNGHRVTPYVGIGASAGGLEAITRLLKGLPAAPGMSLMVVEHLDPSRKSMLTEILGRATPMRVVEAAEGMAIEADHVYVIPPNVNMTVADGALVLRPRSEALGPPMPIDHLFRSMAKDLGRRAIGVVLSGGGTDGSLGLEEIKGEGGITFAQDETALHDSMPRSAIGVGCVDYILNPEGIARELIRIGQHAYVRGPEGQRVAEIRRDGGALDALFALLRQAHGVDFANYKRSTLLRRLQRRMALRKVKGTDDYLGLIRDDPAEVEALYQDFLIRVTSFFRDPASFEALQRATFPALLRDRTTGEPIRIWVAGCATGEEVYSLAIALLESIGDMASNTPIKILATDLSESSLERARSGRYIENIAMDVSPERLRRFFVRAESHYQISKSIRDLCVFSRHDLIRDPPFAGLDLVSCRNVLIYFNLTLQRRVVPLFHYALRPGGHLLLGAAESLGSFPDLFAMLDRDGKVYARKETPGRKALDFDPAGSTGRRSSAEAATGPEQRGLSEVQREADRVVLARFGPPGVVVDESLSILQFRGPIGPFLEPSPGQASLDLMKMVRGSLVVGLRATIGRARAEDHAVRSDPVQIPSGADFRRVAIEVIPLRASAADRRHFLILFEEEPPSVAAPPGAGATPGPDASEVARIGLELDAARQYIQSLVELHEATKEELVTANEAVLSINEELQSTNEELQSTNEELQTAKEEMQSANEELATVNDELRHRNSELGGVNDDLLNLILGLSIPIVMVNRELKIRRYTPPAEKLLNLIASDVGRPIGDIRSNLDVPDLEAMIAEVIDTLGTKEVEVRDRSGRWYSLRIKPYITSESKIDGAAIAILDVDALKRSQEHLKAARDYADAIVESVWEPLVVLDQEMRVRRANRAFFRTFRLTPQEAEGRVLYDLGAGRWWDRQDLRGRLDDILGRDAPLRNFEIECAIPGSGPRTFLLSGHRIAWEGHDSRIILLTMEDVTDRRREAEQGRLLAVEMAARAEAELANRNKDEFLAMLAHELRNPLAPVLNSLLTLRSPDRDAADVDWAVEIMERQVRHMARLVDDLLDVSRITQGKIELRRERVELASVVSHAIETARPSIEAHRHRLDVALPDAPVSLEADPARLEQVISNLLNNAAKYTEDGGRIGLAAEVDGGELVLRVDDSGVGIAPEVLPTIFDLFIQADQSLDRSQGGLGIGLTLVQTLVSLHGGSVSVRSEGIGRGSEFTVRLPLPARPDPARPADAPPDPGEPMTPRRIIVVDDNVDAALTLARLLGRWGHDVRVVHDGPDCLEAARASPPDLVLLDIGLPGMDGYQVARRLRRDTPGSSPLLLVAITGYGQDADRLRSREAGFDLHLVKPVNLDDLRDLLTRR